MKSLNRIPLLFLIVASLAGLLLRWHHVEPVKGLTYPYWLHGHSHIMFLGWVFNTLFLAFVNNLNTANKKRYVIWFGITQFLLIGMMISFPLQGYGAISIALSTLHTLVIGVFCWWIFGDLKKEPESLSNWFAKKSLVFFLLSALGPFTLGPLVANGLGQSQWYFFSVYYYLHFQYNGVFIFGILAIFFKWLEDRNVIVARQKSMRAGEQLFWATFPGYALSLLWAKPGMVFNLIGFSGAVLQILAAVNLMRAVGPAIKPFWSSLSEYAKPFLFVAGISFAVKVLLQLISAFQPIADLAYEVRPFTIAYLHLVLIGVVSFFLLGWNIEKKITLPQSMLGIALTIIGFIVTESLMIAGPLTSNAWIPLALFISSMVLFLGFFIVVTTTFRREGELNSK